MWYILDSNNVVVSSSDAEPNLDDLGTRNEIAVPFVDSAVAMGSIWDSVALSFSPPIVPEPTLTEATNSKTLELIKTRQQKIAGDLGTTVTNLANHESHLLRIVSAAQDARLFPADWQNKYINGTLMGIDNTIIVTFADSIIATQRLNNEAVEITVNAFNGKIVEVENALTVVDMNAITWI